MFCLLMQLSCAKQAPRSPFQGLEWSPDGVVCNIDNQRYRLLEVGNVTTSALLESCKKKFGQNWITVFESDFDAVMRLMNLEGNAVSLGLFSLVDSTSSTQTIPLLEGNIKHIKAYRLERAERISRPLPDSLSALFSPAARTFNNSATSEGEDVLPAATLLNDLSHIEWLLENHSIYLHDSLSVYREAIDALRFVGQNGLPADDFYTEALLFFASCRKAQPALRIRTSASRSNIRQLLPIHLHEIGSRLAAFSTHDNSLLKANYPYLVQINGVAIDQWLNAATDIYGSSFLDETRDVEISRVNLISRRFGIEPTSSIMLGLESTDGSSLYVKQVQATNDPIHKRKNPIDLADDMEGYISLSGRQTLDFESLREKFVAAKTARALIIDLRQTMSLAPSELAELLGVMMPAESKPVIVAAQQWRCDEWKDARSPMGFDPTSGFFPHYYPDWSVAEREIILQALETYDIPEDTLFFSDPHFLLASPMSNSLNIRQPIIWFTDHSSSGNATLLIEASRKIFKRSYHIGVPLEAPVGSSIKRNLASGAEVEVMTSRMMDSSFKPFPIRSDPDRPLFESPEDLQQNNQPILRAVHRFLEEPFRTAGSY